MQITRDMEEKMILSLLRHDKTPSGYECSFFQFGTVGVKFYGYSNDAKAKANNALAKQKSCYAAGLAPKPGELFSIPLKGAGIDSVPIVLYGYTTEVAIISKQVPECDRENLYTALSQARLPSGDLYPNNVGYVVDEKNDTFKLVPIDFGWHFGYNA